MDKRGIYETELWGAGMWAALLLLIAADVWFPAWTWAWAVALTPGVALGWLCIRQYGAAKDRAEQRREEAVRCKFLALPLEQRREINALARRGEICLSDDDAEGQIDAALRSRPWPSCAIVVLAGLLLAGCAASPPREASPLATALAERGCVTPTGLFGVESNGMCVPTVPEHVAREICDRQAAGGTLTPAEDEIAAAHCE